jgi:hypothetical protein
MEQQKERISHFSKIVLNFLNIAFVVLIVVAVLVGIAWIWTLEGYPTDTITVGDITVESPLLFKSGDFRVFLPITWVEGDDVFGFHGLFSNVTLGDFLSVIFTVIGVAATKRVFRLLRDDGSPFRPEVVRALKRLAITLIILGVMSGVIPLLAAGIIWVLCLIFEYGCSLQNESDTTL